MTRVPEVITDDETGETLTFDSFMRDGKDTTVWYRSQKAELFGLQPWMIAKEFITELPTPKGELIRQGRYECAAASLAMLLGHTLFQVRSVMGAHGWCNDNRGVGDRILRLAARDFGRDLISGGLLTIEAFAEDMPDCLVSIRSLNVKGMGHGVVFLDGEILDPNFGDPTRKCWSSVWTPYTMGAKSVQVLAKKPLTDLEYEEIREVRRGGKVDEIRDAILAVAA